MVRVGFRSTFTDAAAVSCVFGSSLALLLRDDLRVMRGMIGGFAPPAQDRSTCAVLSSVSSQQLQAHEASRV